MSEIDSSYVRTRVFPLLKESGIQSAECSLDLLIWDVSLPRGIDLDLMLNDLKQVFVLKAVAIDDTDLGVDWSAVPSAFFATEGTAKLSGLVRGLKARLLFYPDRARQECNVSMVLDSRLPKDSPQYRQLVLGVASWCQSGVDIAKALRAARVEIETLALEPFVLWRSMR